MSFAVATALLLIVAALIAAKAVLFRVWGAAYLGPSTVNSANMVAGRVMADGPYRYMRNPLYIGLWCMVIALAFLMPVSGALFALMLIAVFAHSPDARRRSISYRTARRALPGIPASRAAFHSAIRGAPPPSGAKPHWLRASLAELTPIGIFIAIVVYAKNYDAEIAGRIILIFFGASLVVRAFMPRSVSPEPAQ